MDDLEKNLLEQFSADQQNKEVDRQRKIAEILLAQGLKQPQGQMVSGYYIAPSWTQQLAPLVSTAMGASMSKDLDKKEIELAKALRAAKAQTEESIINKMTGTPDQVTEMAGPYGMSGSGQNIPMPIAYQQGKAPDLAGALREINTNRFGAGKDMKAAILKQMMPDPTELERNYRIAKSQGYQGTITDYKNQMTDSQAAQLKIDMARLNFDRQRLANDNARLYFDTGMGGGMPGGMPGGAGFMPMPGNTNPMINSAMPGQPQAGAVQGGGQTAAMPQYQYNPALSPKDNMQAAAKFNEDMQKNVKNAKGAFEAIKLAAPILQSGSPSSGGLNAAVTSVREFFGGGGDASAADNQLRVLGGALVGMQPRFEGPQGVLDVELYKQMAGDIANPNRPIQSRMASLRSMIEMHKKYDPTQNWDSLTQMLTPQQKSTKQTSQKNAPVGLTNEDKQALDWANQNPNDPRAAAIKQKLGQK